MVTENIDAVVNLAGENIFGRWTNEKKKRIFNSRVNTTKSLCNLLSSLDRPPKVLVSASATGIYGDRGNEILTEESPFPSVSSPPPPLSSSFPPLIFSQMFVGIGKKLAKLLKNLEFV